MTKEDIKRGSRRVRSHLRRRGERLATVLRSEGRPDDAQTVTALLEQLEVKHGDESAVDSKWLTTGDVARRIGVTRQTVVNWVNKGLLPGHRVGGRTLIAPAALHQFAELERILDDLDAERPPATPQEAADAVANSRRGWSWQEHDE